MMLALDADFSKAQWRKSSRSTAGNDCVEVAAFSGVCAVRDSKNPAGGHLAFRCGVWRRFLATLTNHTPGPGLQ
jgi:Domain of unknown function (DUF397)